MIDISEDFEKALEDEIKRLVDLRNKEYVDSEEFLKLMDKEIDKLLDEESPHVFVINDKLSWYLTERFIPISIEDALDEVIKDEELNEDLPEILNRLQVMIDKVKSKIDSIKP